jgi:uncharacterized protein (DUF1684 family)
MYLKILFVAASVICVAQLRAQQSYNDSLQQYQNKYVKDHEVVKGEDKKYFEFFPIDENYRVVGQFEKAKDTKWFSLATSGNQRKTFRVYGTVSLQIHDTLLKLNLYQAQSLMIDPALKDYLALMFTDKTTGSETYEAGRYIDLDIGDIKNNTVVIDFNKAYNPYCAYVKGKYNCPIPPRENDLPVAITAGEKTFEKK